jgi:hypothetical protein
MEDRQYSGVRSVLVVADARLRIPISGGLSIPWMSACLGVGGVVAWVVLVVPIPLPQLVKLLVLGVVVGAGIGFGWVNDKKEGVWVGTRLAHRRFARHLMANTIVAGTPHRTRVKVTVGEDGGAPLVERARLGAALARRGWLAGLASVPRVETVDTGLMQLAHRGWCAVVAYEATEAPLGGGAWQQWCDAVFRDWLQAIKAPVQFLTLFSHLDRRAAEVAFDEMVAYPSPEAVNVGSADARLRIAVLASERELAGAVAGLAMELRHFLVITPGASDRAGVPHLSYLHKAWASIRTGRDVAERALRDALQSAPVPGVTARPASVEEIRWLVARSILGARDAVASDEGIWADGRWHQSVCLQKLGPEVVAGLVVNGLTSAMVEGAASVHVFPTDVDEATRRLRREISTIETTQSDRKASAEATAATEQLRALEMALVNKSVLPGRMAVTVTLSADTREALDAGVKKLVTELSHRQTLVLSPSGPGFLPLMASAPGGSPLGRSVFMVTSDFAPHLLPIMGTPYSDPRMPLVGMNLMTGAPAYWTPFAADSHCMLVVGKGGAGKTIACETGLVRESYRPMQVPGVGAVRTMALAIDPKGEYEPAFDLMGGRYVELGRESLNVLAVAQGLEVADACSLILPALCVMAGDEYGGAIDGQTSRRLNVESQSVLELRLAAFFRGWDWRSAGEPVLSDFVAHISQVAGSVQGTWERERLTMFARRLQAYTLGMRGLAFNRRSTFSLLDGISTGLGLKEYAATGDNLTPVFAIVMTCLRRAMRSLPGRKIVLVDEAHYAFEDRSAAQVLDDLIREGRAYHTSVIMASQKPQDFMSGLGQTLAGLAETHLILGLGRLEPDDAEAAKSVFGLDASQLGVLTGSKVPGLAVLQAPGQSAVIRVCPGDELLSVLEPRGRRTVRAA